MTTGTKVTTDPRSGDIKVEGAGIVNSDSLAGESLKQGGSFAANGASVASTNQPAHSTTTNTTDISAATTLAPAVDAHTRQANEEWSEEAQLKAGRSLGSGTVDAPPSSIQPSMPKGKNLEEGGFDSDDPNASFTTGVGDKRDPARQAIRESISGEQPGAGSGAGDRSKGISNDGQFDNLGETSA